MLVQMARNCAKYQTNFIKFCLIGFSGAIIQIGLTRLFFYILTTFLNIDGVNANTISVVAVIPITTVWNFLWNVFWVFKK